MPEQSDFGSFLKEKRLARHITLRRMAELLGVSAPFLSDVEKSRRGPLSVDKMQAMCSLLALSDDEQAEMYDLAGRARNMAGQDLQAYIMDHASVALALRTARDMQYGEAEWRRIVEDMLKRKDEILSEKKQE